MNNVEQNETNAFDWQDYGENVAAISESLFRHPEVFSTIFERIGNQIGGTGGIWDFLARASKIFTDEAALYAPGEDYNWYEAIEDYADKFIDYLANGEIPDEAHLHRIACGSIELNFI